MPFPVKQLSPDSPPKEVVHAGRETCDTPANALALLAQFCREAGVQSPTAHPLYATEMPQPSRDLLVHSLDMTPTLERFYGCRAGLQVLSRHRFGSSYVREVLLTAGQTPIEYGVIRINLKWFDPSLQQLILQERLPLGRLLQDHAIPHLCWPQGFYRFDPHPYLQRVLTLDKQVALYGRRNVMVNAERRLLADVLEVLAPAPALPATTVTGPKPISSLLENLETFAQQPG